MANKKRVQVKYRHIKQEPVIYDTLQEACEKSGAKYQTVINYRSHNQTTTYKNRYIIIEEVDD